MTRVLHVITDLRVGGAERMLSRLAERLPALGIETAVVSLGERSELGPVIEAAGVPVLALGMRSARGALAGVPRLARRIRDYDPDVVQTWLYHADLVGLLANRLAGGARPLAWNLRCSDLDMAGAKPRTRAIRRILAGLSSLPDLVIANSAAGLAAHRALGYRSRATLVVPNGFDVAHFAPDATLRATTRAALGVAPGQGLIGMLARVDSMKDHHTFLRAAVIAAARRPELAFLLAGQGTERDGPVAAEARALGIAPAIHFLGRRDDVPALLNALDVATLSSSHGEGFANVLGEAMACGVPCVATDVGDAADIIAATGIVVPPRLPDALAGGWLRMLALPAAEGKALAVAARRRVAERFEIGAIAARYACVYAQLARRDRTAPVLARL